MPDRDTDQGLRSTPPGSPDSRDVEITRQLAFDALLDYGLLSRDWNAPDDDHTRIHIRNLAEAVVDAVFRDV